jgi:hypothetical protein
MKRARPATVVQPELVEDDDFGTSESAPPEETETVIVARGIIIGPHPTETRVLRMGEDGKPVLTPTGSRDGLRTPGAWKWPIRSRTLEDGPEA